MDVISIESKQFERLIDIMGSTQYVEILLTQGFALLIAIATSFFIQKLFRDADDRKKKTLEVHQFNEAVIYIGSIMEDSDGYISELIIPSLNAENNFLKEIELRITNPKLPPLPRFTFHSIRPFDSVDKNAFVPKIPDIGSNPEALSAFYRLISQLEQARAAAMERKGFAYAFSRTTQALEPEEAYSRVREIQQRTLGILLSMEAVLEFSMHISVELSKIKPIIKNDLIKQKIKNIKVYSLEYNQHHDETRLKARKILDMNPNWVNRLHYFPAELQKDIS